MEHSIQLNVWQTKHEMISFLRSLEVGYLILGENPEQEEAFYTVSVLLGPSQKDRFGVGICSQGHGLIPALLLQPESSTLMFGFNSDVVGIEIPYGTVSFRLGLDALFYSFLPVHKRNMVLVLHEIGAVALNQKGQMMWKFAKDVVTGAVIEEEFLYLTFMDSPPIRVHLSTGIAT